MAQATGRGRRTTLADVARHAGVSTTTASFVLSGRTDMRISTGTADRVQQSARVLGYTPSLSSRTVLSQRMPALAFVSDTIATEPFAGMMIRGAMAAASERGYSVIVAESQGAVGLEASTLKELLARGVDRFVYATAAAREVRLRSAQAEVAPVLANCVDRQRELPSVMPDDRRAGGDAVRALREAGHADRIWLVGGVSRATLAGTDRRDGVVEALAEHGLTLERHLHPHWWPPDARAAMTDALGRHRRPTAVIALNDRVALGVYQAAAVHGLRIPDDLSVISFDNSDLAWWLSPGLSSLALPHVEMGRRAVEALLAPESAHGLELLPMPLHARESVASLTAAGARTRAAHAGTRQPGR